MPQIVLTVPPEIIRLLTGIQSSLQRIETEIREAKLRLAWSRPASAAERPSARVESKRPEADSPAQPPQIALVSVGRKPTGNRLTHMPAGPEASKRMRALLARTALSGVKLALKLNTHQTTVSMVARGRLGISHRLHEAMTKLEARG